MFTRIVHQQNNNLQHLKRSSLNIISSSSSRITRTRIIIINDEWKKRVISNRVTSDRSNRKRITAADVNKNENKKNFIKIERKPYTDSNRKPWYIDEGTGKANGFVVIAVFLLSQVFIGTVLQPLMVYNNQFWAPIVGGNLYLDNIY